MLNYRIIYKVIGTLLYIEAVMMMWCMGISLYMREDDSMAFIIAVTLTLMGGIGLRFLGRKSENSLGRREAYLLVTLTWIIFSLFGSLPFIISGYISDFTNAYFETISGFTTTGCSILDEVEVLPHGLLFWRTMTQWIGGLGIVFFTIAIIPSLMGGNVKVFSAEATGPMRSKMHPRLSTMAKWIWTIYLGLTIACVLSFYACGMSWFDSINYAMTTTATGGFATHNDTTTYFNSPAIEYVSVLYQFLAGINFAMLYMAIFKFKVGNLFRSSEFKLYIFIIVSATVFIAYLLITRNGYGLERAFRSSLFHVVSFMTTTGIFNDDAAMWPRITWIVLGCLMFIGACSGSTTGGFKCIRLVMVFKVLRNEFRRILHPNAILPVKVNGQTVSQQKLSTLLAFFAIFTVMVLITATLMVMAGIDYTNSTVISLSCISNVGASLSTEIGPVLSWGELPIHIKWTCSFLMLVGRLEIMSVLVLFTRAFWKDN